MFIKFIVIFTMFQFSSSQSVCTSETFSENRFFSLCKSLPVLSSTLHWTYHPTSSTVDLAYRARQSPDGWIAWALNPTGTGMDGAQTIFAFRDSSGKMIAISTPIRLPNLVIENSSLSFRVYKMDSEFRNDLMTIYATIELPRNRTEVNHVWQSSNEFSHGFPSGHSGIGPNVVSTETLNFLSGQSAVAGAPRIRRRNTHGVLNAVSWGILMPLGAIIARYMRVFESADPAWFYLHVFCQCSAYAIGVAGWATGLKLGDESKGITHYYHRNIGISLFTLATIQIFALLLRPKKDHKYRFYWNIYHRSIGYAIIAISIVNIFKGFGILDPDQKWKLIYIVIITSLGGISAILELATWGIVLKRKKMAAKPYRVANEVNDISNGGRQHQSV